MFLNKSKFLNFPFVIGNRVAFAQGYQIVEEIAKANIDKGKYLSDVVFQDFSIHDLS